MSENNIYLRRQENLDVELMYGFLTRKDIIVQEFFQDTDNKGIFLKRLSTFSRLNSHFFKLKIVLLSI